MLPIRLSPFPFTFPSVPTRLLSTDAGNFSRSYLLSGTKQDLKELKERLKRKVPVSAAKGGKPVLIVCPSGLVDSWQEHLGKWGYFESQDVRSSKGIGNKSMQVWRSSEGARARQQAPGQSLPMFARRYCSFFG